MRSGYVSNLFDAGLWCRSAAFVGLYKMVVIAVVFGFFLDLGFYKSDALKLVGKKRKSKSKKRRGPS